MTKTGTLLAAAAATAFIASGIVATLNTAEAQTAGVKCVGANACKGQSACKTASSSCKGLNACKGQGWIEAKDKDTCTKAGGKAG
jgi:hypothetical protein